jgi:hypothetical protein
MCRGFPYETGTTCKKESKISVKMRILRSITLSRYSLDDHQRVATLYHLEGIPTSYFIDRQGIIRSVVVGPVDEATLQQYVAQSRQ